MKSSTTILFTVNDLEGRTLVYDPERTLFGIVQSEYDSFRRLRNLPTRTVALIEENEAITIYDLRYWRPLKCAEMPDGVDLIMFQMGVNIGVSRAARILQKAVGATQDGVVGPNTIKETLKQDRLALMDKLLKAQDAYYDEIATTNPARNEKYIKGWHARVAKVRARLGLVGGESGSIIPILAGLALLLIAFILVTK